MKGQPDRRWSLTGPFHSVAAMRRNPQVIAGIEHSLAIIVGKPHAGSQPRFWRGSTWWTG